MNSSPINILVDSGSVATMMTTRLTEQVISILIEQNQSLKNHFDTQSNHENEMQKFEKEV